LGLVEKYLDSEDLLKNGHATNFLGSAAVSCEDRLGVSCEIVGGQVQGDAVDLDRASKNLGAEPSKKSQDQGILVGS
jgi:hypothetical protein